MVIVPFVLQEKDSKLSELESENRKMKVELEEFRAEAAHLKNQQATIRRLEERTRQLEQQVSMAMHNKNFLFVLPFFFFFFVAMDEFSDVVSKQFCVICISGDAI